MRIVDLFFASAVALAFPAAAQTSPQDKLAYDKVMAEIVAMTQKWSARDHETLRLVDRIVGDVPDGLAAGMKFDLDPAKSYYIVVQGDENTESIELLTGELTADGNYKNTQTSDFDGDMQYLELRGKDNLEAWITMHLCEVAKCKVVAAIYERNKT